MQLKIYLFLFFLSFYSLKTSIGQSVSPYSFSRVDTVEVKSGANLLKFPWAGGINSAQFGAIDLNLDGIKDLIVFDRTGNKISTYINGGSANTVDYSYNITYRNSLPTITNFMIVCDYNCDGKEDIFTYAPGGMACYKNISSISNGLKFMLVKDLVRSKYGSSLLNLYISSVDIPALVDLDNDGDLDVLTFSLLGSYVEHHLNKSKEMYGHCDSLVFEMVNGCWGSFYENASNNNCTLGITCKGGGIVQPTNTDDGAKSITHSGSTLLAFDGDGDGDKELLLGDVSHTNIIYLNNTGNAITANMGSQIDSFPINSKKVNIPSFPGAFYLDVNNDGKKDMLFSPNTNSGAENTKSVWYYKNQGTVAVPDFIYNQDNFLQEQMIDVGEGAHPVFVDFDNDGLMDIAVGTDGYYQSNGTLLSKLAMYRNIGSLTKPKFQLISLDYSSISQYKLNGLYPTFGDLDADGDKDLIIGLKDGTLVYFENTATIGTWASYTLTETNYQNIQVSESTVPKGQFATPQLVDVDRDGLLDLLIGQRSNNGKIEYYRNKGTSTNPVFILVSKAFGNVNIAPYGETVGYSSPKLIDDAGIFTLFSGSINGGVFRCTNIDGNLAGSFTIGDSTYIKIYEGIRSSLDIKDITGDGKKDMVIGNLAGGISFYINDPTKVGELELKNNNLSEFIMYPNPASTELTIELNNRENKKINSTIFIYNLLGQDQNVDYLQINENKISINTSRLANGIYIVQINNNGLQIRERVVIQH